MAGALREVRERIARVAAGEAFTKVYSDQADKYEEDLKTLGCMGISEAVKKMSSLIPDRDACILDYGCGVGLLGEKFLKKGYSNVYGVDSTRCLVNRCQEKKIYRETKVIDQTTIPYKEELFDVVIAVGAFGSQSDIQDETFTEIVRVLQPGGFFINVLREGTFDQVGKYVDLKGIYEDFANKGAWVRLPLEEHITFYKDQRVKGVIVTVQIR